MNQPRQAQIKRKGKARHIPLWPDIESPQKDENIAQSACKIALQVQKGVEFVDPQTVTHLEAQSNYTTIYCTGNRRIVLSRTLKSCLTRFPMSFLRIHQSYLVNPQYLQTYLRQENTLCLGNGLRLPVSRSGKVVLYEYIRTITNESIAKYESGNL